MAFPGKWDGWARVSALSSLLFSGVQLPTQPTLNVLNPTIEHMVTEGLWNDQNRAMLINCLCFLPFLDDPSIGFVRLRQVISEIKLPVHDLRGIVTAVGGSRSAEALTFLREIASSLGDKLRHIRKEWIKAIAALGSPESKRLLLGFIDTEADGFLAEVTLDDHETDFLASVIADMALSEVEIKQRVLRLCNTQLSATKRLLLCKVIAQLGTFDAVIVGLSLFDDSGSPSVPYELEKSIEAVFLEQRPYGKTGSFTLVPKESNEIRAKLFEMAIKDERRKNSAFALLGQIEVYRLEHGRPTTEPRHPAFDSGKVWPPITAQPLKLHV